MNIQKIILPLILAALILGGGHTIYRDMQNKGDDTFSGAETVKGDSAADDSESAGEEEDVSVDVSVPDSGVRANLDIPVPDLDAPVSFSDSFPPDARIIMEEKIAKNRAALKENPSLFVAWLEIGAQYKIAGDYAKASEAWEYASAINPKDSVSLQNLGDLYGYYLKDASRAEGYFLAAIDNAPDDAYLYMKTSDFYREVMRDAKKAREIVEKGIERNPDSQELKDYHSSVFQPQ